MKTPVYLDNQATTPVDARVFEIMRPFFMDCFGNPGSRTHEYGNFAADAIEDARQEIAKAINAQPSEIIFTSGTTESNNIAIQGVMDHLKKLKKRHIITSRIEHKSVLDVLAAIEKLDFEVTFLSPRLDGTLDLQTLINSIRPDTGLISIMNANNEIGVINPIEQIGVVAEQRNILFHCDAAQTIGKLPIDVRRMKVDLLSFSAHKIYGPKGVGALYIKASSNTKVSPIYHGGGQEKGLRPGTLAPALAVGLAEALRISVKEMEKESIYIQSLRDQLLNGLKKRCTDIVVNGTLDERLVHNLNISFLGVPSDTLMMNLRGKVAVSSGSACTSYEPTPSYVLSAMGIGKESVECAIRLGIGRFTTREEIEFTVENISNAVNSLRTKFAVN